VLAKTAPVRPVLHDFMIALSNLCARRDGTRVPYAACNTGSRKISPLIINAQTIRAILLASATAAIFVVLRSNSFTSQGRFVPWR
jgi:hypothetical protein